MSLWTKWMDGFAEKRPNGLVARFRRLVGRPLSPRDLETAEEYVARVKKETERIRKR